LKREMEIAKTTIADRTRRLSEIHRTLERATQEKEQFTGGESELQTKIEELTLVLATEKERLSTIKDRLEQSSAKLNGALEKIKELHKATDHKGSATNQIALELEKLSSDLTHLVQNLEEKYGPGCLERPETIPVQEEMTDPVVTAEMTAEEEQLLGEEVERIRERIRRLGEVNVMAIEEYEELKKRYDHLVAEKADLLLSIQNLEDAIAHINKTSEERFKKAFDAISDRFQRLFPIIFGGGSSHLTLVYPEGSTDILEAGVDILAQPPGKKVSNITLLSGGEKALTAVSLIFAIFMVKPSPFCVLDEVDAPLDDANIGKFNALLREMSVKSQFILITHNKKTMELNDTLYGVTMEEPGVSKMVSIELH
jgi:chromosome segregation protein